MGLVELVVEQGGVVRRQRAPIEKAAPLTQLVLGTPLGRISVERYRDRIVSAGSLVPTAALALGGQPTIASVSKGISGEVGRASCRERVSKQV